MAQVYLYTRYGCYIVQFESFGKLSFSISTDSRIVIYINKLYVYTSLYFLNIDLCLNLPTPFLPPPHPTQLPIHTRLDVVFPNSCSLSVVAMGSKYEQEERIDFWDNVQGECTPGTACKWDTATACKWDTFVAYMYIRPQLECLGSFMCSCECDGF